MAGMEGGVGGPKQEWKTFWLGMLAVTVVLVSINVVCSYYGWIY